MPDWSFEKQSCWPVAGVDEVGRGPSAGPVVAAAVIIHPDTAPEGLQDSKKLTKLRRERLYDAIRAVGEVGVGLAEPEEIDARNILNASMRAMERAVATLKTQPASALVDGDKAPALACETRTVIGGDGVCASIAAASIIAKVTRDRLMQEADARWPGYGFAQHAGYPTRAHAEALARLGPCPIHRRSYAPVRAALANTENNLSAATSTR